MSTTLAHAHPERGLVSRWLIRLGLALVWFLVAVLSLWAMAALYIDVRVALLRVPLAILYAVVLVVILVRYKLHLRAALLCLGCFCLVLG
jgi:hypothetical protein